MTPTYAPMRIRRGFGAAVRLALAASFAAAWHWEAWLIVTAAAAAAMALAATELVAERALAERAATLALFAPVGVARGQDLERAIAADLACVAAGDRAVLEACRARVDEIPDPWLRGLATERLQQAWALVDAKAVPARPSGAAWMAQRGVLWALAASAPMLALAAVSAREPLVLLPLAVVLATMATGTHEARRRSSIWQRVCGEAMTPPVRGELVMREPDVVAAVTQVVSGRARVLAQARALASTLDGPLRETALARLASAGSCVSNSGSARRSALMWAAACGAAVAVLELL